MFPLASVKGTGIQVTETHRHCSGQHSVVDAALGRLPRADPVGADPVAATRSGGGSVPLVMLGVGLVG